MVVVVCVEDRWGMLFHKRRVSQDRVVYQDLLESCPTCLWMQDYSAALFANLPQEKIKVADTFLQQAQKEDWCFVEKQSLKHVESAIEQVILYRWNRKYPADFYFDLDLSQWILLETKEFVGNSHEKITKEVYRRK